MLLLIYFVTLCQNLYASHQCFYYVKTLLRVETKNLKMMRSPPIRKKKIGNLSISMLYKYVYAIFFLTLCQNLYASHQSRNSFEGRNQESEDDA